MKIVPKERLEPNLPAWCGTLFRHFIEHANIPNLHPNDWRQFYEFVRASSPALTADDVAVLLMKEGFQEQSAMEMSSVYSHLRDFMRSRDAREILELHALRQAFKTGKPRV